MYARTGGFDNRGLISEAAFRLGQISEKRYLEVELRLDSESLQDDFELKCERLLELSVTLMLCVTASLMPWRWPDYGLGAL